jgi:hypothetical protein
MLVGGDQRLHACTCPEELLGRRKSPAKGCVRVAYSSISFHFSSGCRSLERGERGQHYNYSFKNRHEQRNTLPL